MPPASVYFMREKGENQNSQFRRPGKLNNGGSHKKRAWQTDPTSWYHSGRRWETLEKISTTKLGSCVTNTINLIKNASMIILAARSQKIREIVKYQAMKDSSYAILHSSASSYRAQLIFWLQNIENHVHRSWNYIRNKGYLCYLFQKWYRTERINLCVMKKMQIRTEAETDAFTTGICITLYWWTFR